MTNKRFAAQADRLMVEAAVSNAREVKPNPADPDPYNWPLPTGKPLGEATVEDLEAAIAFYDKVGNANARAAEALRKLKTKRTVK